MKTITIKRTTKARTKNDPTHKLLVDGACVATAWSAEQAERGAQALRAAVLTSAAPQETTTMHTATLRNVNRTEEADRLRGRAKRMAEKAAFSVKYTSRNPAGDAGLAGFYFAEAMALYDRAETLRA